jgi:DNA-binding response OmpR family regulator
MPKMDGWETLKNIRNNEKTKYLPVIMITAVNEEHKIVSGLKHGADDYIVKPYILPNLLARIEAVLRRSTGYTNARGNTNADEKVIRHKNIELNQDSARVYVNGKELILTSKEFAILELLLSHPDKMFSKSNIYESVWDDAYIYDDNTLMVHISNLRNKLKEYDTEEYIETIWGMGYRLAK